ncbi:MAG: SpoIIE family protein phosphatase [Actinomycetota bacterium]|nr:SpoIIE family protein phosphatase [Actinomycetota bacterium]
MVDTAATTDHPHLGLLADVLRALAGEETLADLLQRCAESVVARLDAAFTRIWLLDEATQTLVLQASAGLYTHLDGGHGRIPVGAFKIGRIALDRRPHLTNAVADDPDVSDKAWARREGMVAFAGYPLEIGPQLVGVLGLFSRHELQEATLEVLASVADSLALGVVRKHAEAELRQDRQIIDTLHGVGTALARELDVQRLVQAVTDAGTELSGASVGAFFYNVVNEGEAHVLYTLSGAPMSAFEHFGLPRSTAVFGPTFAGEAPIRSPDITRDARYGRNEPHFGMPEGHPRMCSYLAVPVTSRDGEVLGGLFFGHPDVDVFTEASERLVVGIAGHAAIAIENARLYQQARTAAITLQRSLLPRSLPSIEGASLTAVYLPASHHAEIGGDWYDALTHPSGCVTIAVGDVGGHDLAAAAVMGQLRNTVRLSAVDADGAVDAIRRIDRYWTLVGDGGFATVLYAGYEPSSRTLTVASAGHPAPLLIHADGTVEVLTIDPLPALGSGLHSMAADGEELKLDLEPGATVVMFTDGLVERRDVDWDESLARLARAAAAGAALPPAQLCDHLLAEMIGSGHQADDIALLLLSVDGKSN